MISLEDLLSEVVDGGGSDLHLAAGSEPMIRVDGDLRKTKFDPVQHEDIKELVYGVLGEEQIATLEREFELDFSFGVDGLGRFRTNVFFQRGSLGSVFRLVPHAIRGFQELGLPVKTCKELCSQPKGLILVTGATGSGKSTTLAAMIDYINSANQGHIITIEDPIEFVHQNKKCLINQREVGSDTRGFKNALRAVLRQDLDYVLIGEMRDRETIEAALTLAETGHLTFGTLHTSDCVQTINRIIDVFPSNQQSQIRTQLSFSLSAVFAQQLLQKSNRRGRILASEIMISNAAIRSLIREDKAHQIYSSIQTGGKLGMKTMNQSLFELIRAGHITMNDALMYTSDPDDLKRALQRVT